MKVPQNAHTYRRRRPPTRNPLTPLFNTKSKSIGFGPQVVKHLIEAKNGTVTNQTNPGIGTTFTNNYKIKHK
jgi:K+-sensing histidine kinase KdpD